VEIDLDQTSIKFYKLLYVASDSSRS